MESGEYLDRADRCWEERGRPEAGECCAEGHGGGLQGSSIPQHSCKGIYS